MLVGLGHFASLKKVSTGERVGMSTYGKNVYVRVTAGETYQLLLDCTCDGWCDVKTSIKYSATINEQTPAYTIL